MATYLTYIGMLGLALAGFLVGKSLWNRSVGATWLIVPAVLSYMLAFWLVITMSILTRGLVLFFAIAIWAGLWVGKRLARRSARSSR